jgi:chaperonin cofactor prefoldin
MDRVIESARREMASKQEQYEMEFKRLQRNVTDRKRMIGKLQERLQNTIKALREVQNTSTRSV